CIQGLELPLTF
nr:immunoglobulin light chain junction region [Macaca mulatta]